MSALDETTARHRVAGPADDHDSALPSLAVASRGDALTPHLLAALRRRAPGTALVETDLTSTQRYRVAATTFRPERRAWIERFYKSDLAVRLRSQNAARGIRDLPQSPDVVLQVHALFSIADAESVLYIDCTHAQSAALWPAWNPLDGAALRAWYRRETETYRAARHLFAFSEATKQSLVIDYGIDSARVTVTGAGVNFPSIPAEHTPVHPVDDARLVSPPTILFIGNDFVRKGGPVLLEAFRQVREVVPDARLQLVGADVAASRDPGVEVLGRIGDRRRIAQLYAGASVFALPSQFDPYPLVALEAMSFGLPVVTTRQMGTPEMIVDGITGFLIEPGDATALADSLVRMLIDPESARRVGAAARRDVDARFTWDAVVDRMLPVLSDLPLRGTR